MKYAMLLSLALSLLWLTVGCGQGSGGNSTPTPPTITAVMVSPGTATLASGATQQFTATVSGTGAYNTAVLWSASAGTVTSDGLYTAPTILPRGQARTATVTAVANGDRSISASAAVTVNPPVITAATLVWKDIQTVGNGLSAGNAIALSNGNLVVVGFGNLSEAASTESDMALSYAFDGTINPHRYVGPEVSVILPVGLWAATASGNVVLAGGSSPAGQGTVSVFDQNVNLTATDSCPSIQYAGTIGAFAVSGNTVYLGLGREANGASPAIATADVNGNLNCTSLISLPIDTSGRIGSIVAADNLLIATGDFTTSTGTTNVAGWLVKLDLNGTIQGWKKFNNIILPRAVIVEESGSSFIYLVGTLDDASTVPNNEFIWIDKLDTNLNEMPGWPKVWDGDNSNFVDSQGNHGNLANWGNAIVPNPAATGGIIAVGQITELPPNTDQNRGDCGLIAYDPNGNVLWKTRQDFSGGDTCTAAVVDAASMSLFVAGAANTFTDGQQTLTAEFALPGVPAPAAKSRALVGDPQAEEPARGESAPRAAGHIR